MATRPSIFPRFAETAGGTPSAGIVEPTSAKKDVGWVDTEKPPAGIMSWLFWLAYKWISFLDATAGIGIFGDGSDGTHTLDGAATILGMAPVASAYTATRDLFFQDLTINTGITLIMGGFRLYVLGKLTQSGTANINCDGSAGLGATGGAAGGAGGVLAASSGSFGGTGAVPANNPGASKSVTAALGSAGGAGGNGGGGGTGGGSAATAPTAAMGSFRIPQSLSTGMLLGAAGVTVAQGGAGGGGGASGGMGEGAGGGGGGGGGILLIAARTASVSTTATLSAKGGVGAAASGGINAGGGGGGGGGAVIFLYHSDVSVPNAILGAMTAAGGTGGTASMGGSNGSNATAGTIQLAQQF